MKTIAAQMGLENRAVAAPASSTFNFADGRRAREWKTMSAMVRIFCRNHHHPAEISPKNSRIDPMPPLSCPADTLSPAVRGRGGAQVHGEGLCEECRQFLEYAGARLGRCRFGGQKPTCAHCPVHCYQRERREQARVIMRHAGPRMLWKHPVLSLRHWLDGFRKTPQG